MRFGQTGKDLGRGNGSNLSLYNGCHPRQNGIKEVLPQQKLTEDDHVGIAKAWLGRKEVYGIKVFRRCDNCGASLALNHQKDGKLVILECPECKGQILFRNVKGLLV